MTSNLNLSSSAPLSSSTMSQPQKMDLTKSLTFPDLDKKVSRVSLVHFDKFPTQAKISPLPPANASSLYSREELKDFMEEAKYLVYTEIKLLAKTAATTPPTKKRIKVSRNTEYLDRKAKFLNCKHLTTSNEKLTKNLKCNVALFYAIQDLKKDKNVTSSKENIEELERKILKNITNCSKTQSRAKKIQLSSISLKHDTINVNHPKKFECSVSKSCSTKTYIKYKHERKNQKWAEQLYSDIKELKKELKHNIVDKLINDLKVHSKGFGPLSLPSRIAFEQFNDLLNTLITKNSSNLKDNLSILNKTINLIDFYKSDSLFKKDIEMKYLYQTLALKDEKNHILYLKSEEYYRKQYPNFPEDEPIPIEDDTTTTPILKDFLVDVCNYLKQKTEQQINLEKEEKQIFDKELNQVIDETSKHIFRLLKIHKNLSFNRFIDSFSQHQLFINRLYYAINKFQNDEEKQQAQEIIEEVLSPKVMLLDTTGHRTKQGRHARSKEKAQLYKHHQLNSLKKYLELLISKDFTEYQNSHIHLFPGVYVRRSQNAEGELLNNSPKSIFKTAHTSLSYLNSSQDAREKSIEKDIDLLFRQYGDKPEVYMDHVLDVILITSLEESSKTIHLPGEIFNQNADGISEKYIRIGDLENGSQIEKDLQELKQHNEKLKTTNKGNKATDKVYKVVLANNLFNSLSPKVKRTEYNQVLENNKNYIAATKRALARKLQQLTTQPKNTPNLILAISLLNVFGGLKNSEAKSNLDFVEAEDDVQKSVQALSAWIKKEIT